MAADTLMAEINLAITKKITDRLHCPYTPVTAVTGHRNRTVTLKVLPLLATTVHACASVRFLNCVARTKKTGVVGRTLPVATQRLEDIII